MACNCWEKSEEKHIKKGALGFFEPLFKIFWQDSVRNCSADPVKCCGNQSQLLGYKKIQDLQWQNIGNPQKRCRYLKDRRNKRKLQKPSDLLKVLENEKTAIIVGE